MLFAFRNSLLIVKKNRCSHLGTKALSRLRKNIQEHVVTNYNKLNIASFLIRQQAETTKC